MTASYHVQKKNALFRRKNAIERLKHIMEKRRSNINNQDTEEADTPEKAYDRAMSIL